MGDPTPFTQRVPASEPAKTKDWVLENLTGHVVMVSDGGRRTYSLGTDGFELVVPIRDVVTEDVAGVPVTSFVYDVPDNLPAKKPGVLLVVTEQAALPLQLALHAAGVDRDDIVFPSSNGLRRLAAPGAQEPLRLLEVNELDPELLDKLEELDARGVFGPPRTTWPPGPPTAEEVARGAQGRAAVPRRWAASPPDDRAANGPPKPPWPPAARTVEPPKGE